jgi:hypothetical protein
MIFGLKPVPLLPQLQASFLSSVMAGVAQDRRDQVVDHHPSPNQSLLHLFGVYFFEKVRPDMSV